MLNLKLIIHSADSHTIYGRQIETKMLKLQLWQVELFRGVILIDYSAMMTKGSV